LLHDLLTLIGLRSVWLRLRLRRHLLLLHGVGIEHPEERGLPAWLHLALRQQSRVLQEHELLGYRVREISGRRRQMIRRRKVYKRIDGRIHRARRKARDVRGRSAETRSAKQVGG